MTVTTGVAPEVATATADTAIIRLAGGEQQRVAIARAFSATRRS